MITNNLKHKITEKEDEEILEMLEGELKHLEFFEEEIEKNGYKPSILNPIWQKMAFAMGYLSGKHSKKMAMLCTKEVEDVIEKHYQKQIDILTISTLFDLFYSLSSSSIFHTLNTETLFRVECLLLFDH